MATLRARYEFKYLLTPDQVVAVGAAIQADTIHSTDGAALSALK